MELKKMVVKKVFIASPSDTSRERSRVDGIIDEINHSLGDSLGIKFEVLKWENHTAPDMGRPQEIIDRQLKPDQCDVFIGILRTRFGNPSGGADQQGTAYESGTQEEFSIAYDSWKRNRRPTLMMFRSLLKMSTKDVDTSELSKVNKFIGEFSYNGEHPGLYKEYNSIQEFEKALRISLIRYALLCVNLAPVPANSNSLPNYLTESGIENIFIPKLNSQRNEAKKYSLEKTENIYLIAHSCYSFLARFGHRFRDVVEKKLQQGYHFYAVASNPWSEGSYFASMGELYDSLDQFVITDENGKRVLDCISIIEQSRCYKVKYIEAINGYLLLRQKYGDRIQIKFTRYEIMSSILLTDHDCYIEPYLPINLEERYEKGMLTFELRVLKDSYLYQHNRKYFEFLWGLSEDYDAYCTHVDFYKEQLKNKVWMEGR